jgi:kynurenine formamidase
LSQRDGRQNEGTDGKEDWFPSIWGNDDEIGALNFINSSKLLRSLKKTVKLGQAYSLSQPLEYGIPVHWFNGPFLHTTFRNHTASSKLYSKAKNKFAAMSTRMELSDHTGTHIDALNHVSIGGILYNGQIAETITGTFGTEKLGIDKVPPIISRGIHIDITSIRGGNILPIEYLISPDDIELILEKKKIGIEEGDVVLISTGWDQLWMKDNDKYGGPCPGIGLAAADWLVERKVALVGSDTWKVEIHPPELKDEAASVHQFLIAKNGVMLIENMNLQELRKNMITEFLFICLPLKLKGGAGSPVNPIAIV